MICENLQHVLNIDFNWKSKVFPCSHDFLSSNLIELQLHINIYLLCVCDKRWCRKIVNSALLVLCVQYCWMRYVRVKNLCWWALHEIAMKLQAKSSAWFLIFQYFFVSGVVLHFSYITVSARMMSWKKADMAGDYCYLCVTQRCYQHIFVLIS